MKKRIGSKLYDTGTSELIAETVFGKIYRKQTREREWFMVNDENIVPLTDPEARAMLGESTYRDPEPENKRIMIGVDRETHEKIALEAKRRGISIGETVRQIVAETVI